MPEGDTVWRTAHRLNQVFAGHTLASCDLRWPGLSTVELAGSITREVVPRGKHLLHRLASGWTIHSHLRMEGSWRIEAIGTEGTAGTAGRGGTASSPRAAGRPGRADAPTTPPPASPSLRAVLATDAYRALGWSLGMLDVVATADEHTLVGHLGPDILGPDWDADLAIANLRARDATLAAALLDQTNLAGIGTMWASEGLFVTGNDPFATASEVSSDALATLLARIRTMMRASCASAVPASTESRVAAHATYVHGRRHSPCRRCGTLVAMRFTGPPTKERTIYFCPRCQGVS